MCGSFMILYRDEQQEIAVATCVILKWLRGLLDANCVFFLSQSIQSRSIILAWTDRATDAMTSAVDTSVP